MTDRRLRWYVALGAVLLLGFVLRLRGIHDPILDHPGWRQGDTAAIARNFATLDMNPFHPQTDYNGAPPNYVELELQIVPYLAAILYKIFGVNEIFGRLISIAFSLGTIGLCGLFARRLYASTTAGVVAASAFAIYPGSVYYGRTFMPDSTMIFFLTAALYASWSWVVDDDARPGRRFWLAVALTALALLAKPVAIVAFAPIAAALVSRRGLAATLRAPQTYAFFVLASLPYTAYDAYVRTIAEWHWASGITQLHVLPALRAAATSFPALRHKLGLMSGVRHMLASTMLGPYGLSLFLIAIVVPVQRMSRAFLWTWLAALVAYAFVVVTVERVDYYLYAFLPLAAIWTGGFADALARSIPSLRARRIVAAAGTVFAFFALLSGRHAVASYYHYSKLVYRQAKALDATLPPDALVVMGHYDPSVLYYIDRKGWEEDPYLWTPFDEQSAIAKGARSFIAIERRRLQRNVELYAWLQRFPLANADARWPVYETDPAKTLPGAEERWRAFRRAEKAGTLAPQ